MRCTAALCFSSERYELLVDDRLVGPHFSVGHHGAHGLDDEAQSLQGRRVRDVVRGAHLLTRCVFTTSNPAGSRARRIVDATNKTARRGGGGSAIRADGCKTNIRGARATAGACHAMLCHIASRTPRVRGITGAPAPLYTDCVCLQ